MLDDSLLFSGIRICIEVWIALWIAEIIYNRKRRKG